MPKKFWQFRTQDNNAVELQEIDTGKPQPEQDGGGTPDGGGQQRKLQQRLRNHKPGGQCGQRGGGRNGGRGGDADQGTVLLHQRCPEAELLQEWHILFL